ncbi:spore maturation protein A [mine drainage metagenome]|uniref:Spore maturation protein A n=1 Tax=mine drainage metagenome TaxID=410659 RepID=A0A1J5S0Q8_9ZZZZ
MRSRREYVSIAAMDMVFFLLIAGAFATAAWRQWLWTGAAGDGPMAALGQAALSSAGEAVSLGIGLVGALALFLGLMAVADRAGLMRGLARLLRPVLHRLFPEVPPDHPAMGAMVMNVAANMLGLSNAATPFGLKAMRELERLNAVPGTASDSMVLFLALNTANVTLLPTHVMALRAAVGSHDPAAVIATTLFATLWSCGLAVLLAKAGRRWFPVRPPSGAAPAPQGRHQPQAVPPPAPLWASGLAVLAALALLPVTLLWGRTLSPWVIPALIVLILAAGLARRVDIYAAFVAGAREGLLLSLRLIPYLVAILMAVGLFRQSGAMALLLEPVGRLLTPLGLPPQALTMAALRTLSGSASFGYLASLMKTGGIGPDSYLGILLGSIYGSSETTFYVLAVYFGAVGIRRIRHALLVGLLADLAGLAGSVLICRWLYGG